MDKKSKVLLVVFVIMLATSVVATFERYVIKKDYLIYAHVSCDPTINSCFYYEPEEGEEVEYYQKIYRKAYNIPLCDPEEEDCDALTCPVGEAECEIVSCGEETLEEGESCSE